MSEVQNAQADEFETMSYEDMAILLQKQEGILPSIKKQLLAMPNKEAAMKGMRVLLRAKRFEQNQELKRKAALQEDQESVAKWEQRKASAAIQRTVETKPVEDTRVEVLKSQQDPRLSDSGVRNLSDSGVF